MTKFATLPMWMDLSTNLECGEVPVSDPVTLDAVQPEVELNGPAVRWEMIVRLRGLIAAGEYRVASEEIAGKMIDAMMG